MQYLKKVFQLCGLSLCMFIHACGTSIHAPVISPGEKKHTVEKADRPVQESKPGSREINNPKIYTVNRGDTLYSIAWNYGYDYRDVAHWNQIRSPYTIFPGQKINLQPPAIQKTDKPEPLVAGPIERKSVDNPTKTKPAVTESKQPVAKQTVVTTGSINWVWPTQGKIIKVDTPISKNGIDISGLLGQDITAASPGEVVYSGSGLLGYGRLIIIKHNDTYLSAYAHNKELLVKEGNKVTAGQVIAFMGQTNNGRTILHFEIRKNGQPVNPLNYLPKR
jgi:lipoprotein NlpD